MADLNVEITHLIQRTYPAAFTGDMAAIAQATAHTADALGGMFALIRKQAPNEATARAAMKHMVERALQLAEDVR